jgi:disintegrin and metalloproteinase domain-containing protein 10
VEIITKNGPTKKPNIIVNNYNPDLIFANNNPPNNNNKHHPNNPHLYHPHYNVNLNIKNDLLDMYNTKPSTSTSLADRKSTCMLYLQADHTFFQKLGSDEASIEAITRHVQRANVIYKNTGELLLTNLIKIPWMTRHEKTCFVIKTSETKFQLLPDLVVNIK